MIKLFFPKFVITTNTLLLWEKEIINREEVRFMPETMEKEDLEKLQNPLQHRKKNLRSDSKQKDRRKFLRSFL